VTAVCLQEQTVRTTRERSGTAGSVTDRSSRRAHAYGSPPFFSVLGAVQDVPVEVSEQLPHTLGEARSVVVLVMPGALIALRSWWPADVDFGIGAGVRLVPYWSCFFLPAMCGIWQEQCPHRGTLPNSPNKNAQGHSRAEEPFFCSIPYSCVVDQGAGTQNTW
jgi:hypothetical protein